MNNLPPHTAPVDQIVGRLLQLWRAESPISLAEEPDAVVMALGFDLDRAQDQLAHATEQNAGKGVSEKLQHRLDTVREYLGIGKRLNATLENAVQAQRNGRDTGIFTVVLLVEEKDPYQYAEGFFATACIYDWAQDEFGIDVPEWAPAVREDTAKSVATSSTTQVSKYTNLEKEKHQVMIALLMEKLAEKLPPKYSQNGQPNCKQIGELISDHRVKNELEINGLSADKLRHKFGECLKVKKRYQPAGK